MKQHLMLLAILFICALLTALPACDQSATPVAQAPSPAPSRPAPAPTATPGPSPTTTTTPWPTLTPYISPTPSPTPAPSLVSPWEFYLGDQSVSGVTFDAKGNTWIGTGQGVAVRTADGQWETIQAAGSGLADDRVYAVSRDSAGNLWFDTDGGLCVRAPTGEWTTYPDRRAAIEAHYEDILQSRTQSPLWAVDKKHGVVWVLPGLRRRTSARDCVLWTYDGRQWAEERPWADSSLDDYGIRQIAVDSAGNVWIYHTWRSLSVLWYGKGWQRITRASDGIHSDNVVAVTADRTGNVWAGSLDHGLIVHQADGSWQEYTSLNAGLPDPSVLAVYFDEHDNLWVLTDTGVSVRWSDGNWTTCPPRRIWLAEFYDIVAGIAADPAGNVWAWGSRGLYHLPAPVLARLQREPSPTPTPPVPPPSLPDPPEQKALAQDVKLVDSWECRADDYWPYCDWSSHGLAFVYEDAIWVAQGPQFERRLVSDLTRYDYPRNPIWSPDGKYIAFESWSPWPLSYRGNSCSVVRADGSDIPILLTEGRVWFNGWIDERTISYIHHLGAGSNKLYYMDVETGEGGPIYEKMGEAYHWAPTHDHIVVGGRYISFAPLLLIDAAGRDLGTIGQEGQVTVFEDWAPDGKRLLFSYPPEQCCSEPTLWVWDVQQLDERPLLPNTWRGTWSPDGQRIACWIAGTPILDSAGQITGTNYTPGIHGPLHLGFIDSRTEQLKALATVESEWVYYACWPDDPPIWSPDSAHLVYQDQDMDWWLVSLSTLQPRRLTEGLKAITERSGLIWSPDSHYLALITPAHILILEP